MASYSSDGGVRIVKKTLKGRVVYDRKPHYFTERDLVRIALQIVSRGDGVTVSLLLIRVTGLVVINTLHTLVEQSAIIQLLPFVKNVIESTYKLILKEALFLGEFDDIDFLLNLFGYKAPPVLNEKPPAPGPI